jgi:hypothetical protein
MVRKPSWLTGKWLVPTENAEGVVFGVITIGALMAAESGRHESYVDKVASALIATLLYWLVHAYADLLGRRLETGERLTVGALARALGRDFSIVRGAAVPLLALVIAWIAGASLEEGVTAALRTAVITIVVFEVVAGIRAKSTPGELVLKAAVGVLMGLAILALKGVLR